MLETVGNNSKAVGSTAPEAPDVPPWDTLTYSTRRHGASITDCDAEPVRTPGCIQAHGALLVLRLSVDDNVDAAETMMMLLDLSGHDARAAFSSQQALDMAMVFRPNVVFLDIGLPGMNGYEVARHLLASPATASAKLVALTGWGTQEDIRKSKMADFHAHPTKPVAPEAVEAMLATFS